MATLPGARPSLAYRRPVSVLVLVYTPDGDVLLLRRSHPADIWQSVTGSLQHDETHAEAAERELAEETGFSAEAGGELTFSGNSRVFTIDERWRDRFAPGVTENVEFEWHYRLPQKSEIVMDSSEHAEYRWFSLDRAIESVWSWSNREALVELRDRL